MARLHYESGGRSDEDIIALEQKSEIPPRGIPEATKIAREIPRDILGIV